MKTVSVASAEHHSPFIKIQETWSHFSGASYSSFIAGTTNLLNQSASCGGYATHPREKV